MRYPSAGYVSAWLYKVNVNASVVWHMLVLRKSYTKFHKVFFVLIDVTARKVVGKLTDVIPKKYTVWKLINT